MKYSEENIFALMERIGMYAGCQVSTHATHRQIKNADHLWPNLCFNVQLDSEHIHQQLSEIRKGIQMNIFPTVFLFKPGSLSAEMLQVLQRAAGGSAEWAAMTLAMEDWDQQKAKENLEFEVRRVTCEKDQLAWCETTNASMTGNLLVSAELFTKLGNDADFGFFIAQTNGKTVAGGMSFQSNGKAGLYLISTLKAYRGKGLGTAITVAIINHLKQQGVQEIHLQATAAGEPIYAKLGFARHGSIPIFNLK